MSTAAVSSNSLYQQLQSFYQQRQADLKELGQALKSGDLAGAQQAFNALQTLGQSGPFANADPFSNNQREQAFAAIGQALQSGDLAGAQQAFAALQSSFHNQRQDTNASNSYGPAVIVNLGGANGSAGSSSSSANSTASSSASNAGPEIVINLGAHSGPEQLTIDVNNTGGGAEQLQISLGTQQNPASQDQITLNLNANRNEQIILNLQNGPASSPSPSGLSVVA
ncbi:MAG TPA: hypothetical protein VKR60_09385 [Candidatus Sulfotelmatobacter sp.]|nr:hypothetical protein [Candidatus Sulfotelmatobacter sp.]